MLTFCYFVGTPWRILCFAVFDEYCKSESEYKFNTYVFFWLFAFTSNKNCLHTSVLLLLYCFPYSPL